MPISCTTFYAGPKIAPLSCTNVMLGAVRLHFSKSKTILFFEGTCFCTLSKATTTTTQKHIFRSYSGVSGLVQIGALQPYSRPKGWTGGGPHGRPQDDLNNGRPHGRPKGWPKGCAAQKRGVAQNRLFVCSSISKGNNVLFWLLSQILSSTGCWQRKEEHPDRVPICCM